MNVIFDRRQRPARSSARFCVTAALALGASGAHAGNGAPLIQAFNADAYLVNAGSAVQYAFLASDPDGDPMTCTLDVTGGGQTVQYSPCSGTILYDHVYPWGSTYEPRLTVTDGQATVRASLPGDLTMQVVAPTTIVLQRPQRGSRLSGQVIVFATVSSPSEADAIDARLAGIEAPLTFMVHAPCDGPGSDCGPGLYGTLNLSGAPGGTAVLEAEIETVNGQHAFAYRNVMLDAPPTLTVTAPEIDALARPTLHATAQCADELPDCTVTASVRTIAGSYVDVGAATGMFDADVDLSAADGADTLLRFVARDSAGQNTVVERRVFVERSQQITEIDTARGRILDVDPTRLLFIIDDAVGDRLFLQDRSTGAETEMPVPASRTIDEPSATLADTGALFSARPVSGPNDWKLYEWNGTSLLEHGDIRSAATLKVAGRYAVWSYDSTLRRRDLINGVTALIGASSNGTGSNQLGLMHVQPDGVVTYDSSTNGRLLRYDGVTTTDLLPDYPGRRYFPDAEGDRTVYAMSHQCCSDVRMIELLDGADKITLRPFVPAPNGVEAEIEDGWVAFGRDGALGQNHVWAWSPTGEQRRRTAFGTDSHLVRMGRQGDMMIVAQQRHYLSDADARLLEVNSSLGETFALPEGWLIAISRSLFRIEGAGQRFDDGFE